MYTNLGRLRDDSKLAQNIVYFKRGEDEMSLNITNRCPNRCPFCIRDHDLGWGKTNLYLSTEPSIPEIVTATTEQFGELEKEGLLPLKKLKICGYGEPILRIRELPEIVKSINQNHQDKIGSWQLTTTGWPLYHSAEANVKPRFLLKRLFQAGLKKVNLSLHAMTAESYARMVRPPLPSAEAFASAIRFAQECVETGFQVTMVFLKTKMNCEEKIIEFAASYDCSYSLVEYQ